MWMAEVRSDDTNGGKGQGARGKGERAGSATPQQAVRAMRWLPTTRSAPAPVIRARSSGAVVDSQAVLVQQPHQIAFALLVGAQGGEVRGELVLCTQAAVA